MVNFVCFFATALISKGIFSDVVTYDDDFAFVGVWMEVQEEIERVVYHLRNSHKEEGEYVKVVVEQCKRFKGFIGDVIIHLKEETIDHEMGDIIFKRVMYDFQEVYNTLNRAETLNDDFELRSRLIYNLEMVCEHMGQLVYIAKTYCPQLRAVLRLLLVNLLKCVQGFPNNLGILEQNVIIYENPIRMVSQIDLLTQELTVLLGKLCRIGEVRIVLRGLTRYIAEIAQKLDAEAIPDVKVKDVNKNLHEILRTLTKLVTREDSNWKYFQTIIPIQLLSTIQAFKHLLTIMYLDSYPANYRVFLEQIIYYYYYSIKQTHFEIRSEFVNAFFGCLNFNNSVNDFKNFSNEDFFQIDTPKELVIQIQKLVHETTLTKPTPDSHCRELAEILECIITKIENESRTGHLMHVQKAMCELSQFLKITKSQIDKFPFKDILEMITTELHKIVIAEEMQDNGFLHLLVKETCQKILRFLRNVNFVTFVNPKDLIVQTLKTSKEHIEKLDNLQLTNYCFREFVKVLEYVTDKIDKEVKIGHLIDTEMAMESFSNFLKIVKDSLEAAINSTRYIKYEFSDVAEMVLIELYKIINEIKVQDFEYLFLKDVCLQFFTFFQNLVYQITIFREKYV